MELLLEFLVQQWLLVGALAAVVVVLWRYEARKSGPSVSPQKAINLVNAEEGLFLDVRASTEFGKGHIVNALNIPASKLDTRIAELEKYRDRPIILVCKMGQQVGAVGKQLNAEGFTGIYRMSGGMMEWGAQQLPLVE